MPNAGEFNNGVATLAEIAKIVPLMKFSGAVVNLGAPPVLSAFVAVGANPTIGMLTAVRTTGGASSGDYTITWPANMIPPVLFAEATIAGLSPGMAAATPLTNGVRVVTVNASGAAADMPFTVTVT